MIGERFKNHRVKFFPRHNAEILMCQKTPDERHVLSSGRDCRFKFTDAHTLKTVKNLDFEDAANVYCCILCPKRNLLFVGTEKQRLLIWDLKANQLMKKVSFPKNIFCISRIGQQIYYSGWVISKIGCLDLQTLEYQTLNLKAK